MSSMRIDGTAQVDMFLNWVKLAFSGFRCHDAKCPPVPLNNAVSTWLFGSADRVMRPPLRLSDADGLDQGHKHGLPLTQRRCSTEPVQPTPPSAAQPTTQSSASAAR